jgi:hypothetical protein
MKYAARAQTKDSPRQQLTDRALPTALAVFISMTLLPE